jgi:hypothetical protein
MKIYVVIQCDAKVSYYIDRFRVCKSMVTAKKIVKTWTDEGEYTEQNQNGKTVWVTNETDVTSSDSMIYISERELEE